MRRGEITAGRLQPRSSLAALAAVFTAVLMASVLALAGLVAWPGGGAVGLRLAARQQPSPTGTPSPTGSPLPAVSTATALPTKPAARATEQPAQAQSAGSADATATPTLPAAPSLPARDGCVLYPGSGTPQDVPDNDPAGLTATVEVPLPSQPLTSVGVRISELRHPYVGDLRLTLIAPDGTSLMLVDQVGNDTDDFYQTAFYDAAAAPIANAVGPFTGAFQPDQFLGPLIGRPTHGRWTLHVADLVGGDTGTLYAWALELCADEPLPPLPVTAALPPAGGALDLSYLVDAHAFFPAQAEPLTATLSTTGTRPLPPGAAALGSFFVISALDAFGAPLTSSEPPVHITLHYDPADIPARRVVVLQLIAWDPLQGAYIPLPTTRDPHADTLSADLSPLTEFGAIAFGYEVFLPSVRLGWVRAGPGS